MHKTPAEWADSYYPTFNALFEDVRNGVIDGITGTTQAWQKWVDDNTKTMSTPPPLVSSPTTNPTSFAPLIFPNPGTPPTAALIMATAWMAYMSSVTWSIPAPAPPFSMIDSVLPDPGSLGAGNASILSGLTAEMAVIPPPTQVAIDLKALNIATIFATASISSMVLIIGKSLPTPTPVPLILPYPTL